MNIYSSIKEIDEKVFDLEIENEFKNESIIKKVSLKNFQSDTISIQSHAQHSPGICIVETNFQIHKFCTDNYCVKGEFILIAFLLKGEPKVISDDIELVKGKVQVCFQHNLFTQIDMSNENSPIRYINIFLSKEYYLFLLSKENWISRDSFFKHVHDEKEVPFNKFNISLNFKILQILEKIKDNEYDGIYKRYYIETKLKELFFQFHVQLKFNNQNQVRMEINELEKLEAAKSHLILNFKNAPTIKQLSKIVFLNEFKLKSGFKKVYGKTINEFLTYVRMEKAQIMLTENHSVNEVSYLLGYKSVSHFISVYKKNYGFTPKKMSERFLGKPIDVIKNNIGSLLVPDIFFEILPSFQPFFYFTSLSN